MCPGDACSYFSQFSVLWIVDHRISKWSSTAKFWNIRCRWQLHTLNFWLSGNCSNIFFLSRNYPPKMPKIWTESLKFSFLRNFGLKIKTLSTYSLASHLSEICSVCRKFVTCFPAYFLNPRRRCCIGRADRSPWANPSATRHLPWYTHHGLGTSHIVRRYMWGELYKIMCKRSPRSNRLDGRKDLRNV